jgi:hypothetical protein
MHVSFLSNFLQPVYAGLPSSGKAENQLAHKALPEEFGPVPPFSRMHAKTAITELGLDTICQEDSEH